MQTRANAENVVYFRQGSVTRQTEICSSKTTDKRIVKNQKSDDRKYQGVGMSCNQKQSRSQIRERNQKSEGRINKGTRQTSKTKNKGVS